MISDTFGETTLATPAAFERDYFENQGSSQPEHNTPEDECDTTATGFVLPYKSVVVSDAGKYEEEGSAAFYPPLPWEPAEVCLNLQLFDFDFDNKLSVNSADVVDKGKPIGGVGDSDTGRAIGTPDACEVKAVKPCKSLIVSI